MSAPEESVVVVDYGMGNLRSVSKMMDRTRAPFIVSDNPADILKARRLILPGVGAFGIGMDNLRKRRLLEPLNEAVQVKRTPLLGICLGMELLAESSEEHGHHKGLGWLPAHVRRFNIGPELRIPHVGWNGIHHIAANPLFEGVAEGATFYFTHSYVMDCRDPALVTATCDYGEAFAAVVMKDNVFGCQFHPEKSQRNGGIVIHRFLLEDLA